MNSIGRLLVRLFPLLPPEQRPPGNPTLLRLMGPRLQFDRDGDYLTYILFKLVFIVNMLFFGIVLIDNFTRTGFFTSPGTFAQNSDLIPVEFTRLLSWPLLVITLAFYVRIRVSIDLRNELIPTRLSRYALRKPSRWRWITSILIYGAVMVWGVFNFDRLTAALIRHSPLEHGIIDVVIVQCMMNFFIAALPSMLIGMALTLEKTIRYFPEAQQDLLRTDYEAKDVRQK
jgi:hypothetical protein